MYLKRVTDEQECALCTQCTYEYEQYVPCSYLWAQIDDLFSSAQDFFFHYSFETIKWETKTWYAVCISRGMQSLWAVFRTKELKEKKIEDTQPIELLLMHRLSSKYFWLTAVRCRPPANVVHGTHKIIICNMCSRAIHCYWTAFIQNVNNSAQWLILVFRFISLIDTTLLEL